MDEKEHAYPEQRNPRRPIWEIETEAGEAVAEQALNATSSIKEDGRKYVVTLQITGRNGLQQRSAIFPLDADRALVRERIRDAARRLSRDVAASETG